MTFHDDSEHRILWIQISWAVFQESSLEREFPAAQSSALGVEEHKSLINWQEIPVREMISKLVS